MTEVNSNIHLILEGNKTTNKESFLNEIATLLHFPTAYNDEDKVQELNWDILKQRLEDIVNIWENEKPPYIGSIIDSNSVIPKDLVVNVIWLDPLDFSKYNSADFFIALDILKGVNDDESNPLQFALASYVKHINTDLYR